jgi:hypothetical protein
MARRHCNHANRERQFSEVELEQCSDMLLGATCVPADECIDQVRVRVDECDRRARNHRLIAPD